MASASGGAVAIGGINTGANEGNAVGVGDTGSGGGAVDGGEVSATTVLGIPAEVATAIADTAGGDSNVAFVT